MLRFLIVAFNQGKNLVIRGVGLTNQGTGIPIGNVLLRNLVGSVLHDGLFHEILNLFHRRRTSQVITGNGHALCNSANLHLGHSFLFRHLTVSPLNGMDNLIDVEFYFRSVSLDYVHDNLLFSFAYICTILISTLHVGCSSVLTTTTYCFLWYYITHDVVCQLFKFPIFRVLFFKPNNGTLLRTIRAEKIFFSIDFGTRNAAPASSRCD